MIKTRIVVVEDEPDIAEVIGYNLQREGFEVDIAETGTTGLQRIRQLLPQLVLLDLMVPGMDGHTICQQMKSDPKTAGIPIIMVTARGEEADIVIGLGLGADDYVSKPFSPRELIARVKAVLRRGQLTAKFNDGRIEVGELLIDLERHEVRAGDQTLKLTATEFKLLHQLASQPGRVYSREQLLNRVIGEGVVVVDRNIDVHVRAIRKKLGKLGEMIETIRGVGYRFADA